MTMADEVGFAGLSAAQQAALAIAGVRSLEELADADPLRLAEIGVLDTDAAVAAVAEARRRVRRVVAAPASMAAIDDPAGTGFTDVEPSSARRRGERVAVRAKRARDALKAARRHAGGRHAPGGLRRRIRRVRCRLAALAREVSEVGVGRRRAGELVEGIDAAREAADRFVTGPATPRRIRALRRRLRAARAMLG